VTMLAARCYALSIPVDPGRLYDGQDPNFELWLIGICERLEAAHRDANRSSK
jgi:hypothetical protein